MATKDFRGLGPKMTFPSLLSKILTYQVVGHNNPILTWITSVHCGHDCRYGTDEAAFYSGKCADFQLSISSPQSQKGKVSHSVISYKVVKCVGRQKSQKRKQIWTCSDFASSPFMQCATWKVSIENIEHIEISVHVNEFFASYPHVNGEFHFQFRSASLIFASQTIS